MDRIAVLVPCYNESGTIAKVVSDFRCALPEAVVYVYDNNSSDGTDELARAAGAVVRYEPLQGKGNVIRRMFAEIDAQCYVLVDGDDTYSVEAAREMTALVLEKRADMVVGDRLSSTYFAENKRPFHNVGNLLVRRSINTLFHSDIKDIMTGYRAFSYRFVKTLIVCMFMMVAAIQSFFAGQIMQMIYLKSRQDFEHQMIRVMEAEKRLADMPETDT